MSWWLGILGALLVGCSEVATDARRSAGSSGTVAERVGRGAEPVVDATRARGSGPGVTSVRATQVALFDDLVTSFAADPGGSEILVGERSGVVHRLRRVEVDGAVVPRLDPTPALDLRASVSAGVDRHVERGFYDMQIGPGGEWIVVSYRRNDRTLVLDRFDYRAGAPIDVETRRTLVALAWPYPYHHGAGLTLEPDGDLLMGLGDEALSPPGVPPAQDPALLRGGILRVPAGVLADPTVAWSPGPTDMVARGLRHPWRLEVDGATGDLWIGDFGNGRGEEINRVPAAMVDAGGLNFGWPYLQGTTPAHQGAPPDQVFAGPVVARADEEGSCGLVGGLVYRGRLLPRLAGAYLYGDRCNGDVRALRLTPDGAVASDVVVVGVPDRIVAFGDGPGGEVYVLGQYGGVFRLDPGDWDAADNWQPSSTPPTTAPDAQLTPCGIVPALTPLSQVGSLPPDEMRAAMAAARSALVEEPPGLPERLRPARRELGSVIDRLDALLASVDYDLSSRPDVAAVIRNDALSATGLFERLPQVLEQFLETECR